MQGRERFEGFLLPKNMIHETIRDADNSTELEAYLNSSGHAVLVVSTLSEPETGWNLFAFDAPEDIDWLVKRLRALAFKWRSSRGDDRSDNEEVDLIEIEMTQITRPEAIKAQFDELRKTIAQITDK